VMKKTSPNCHDVLLNRMRNLQKYF
jgi:hypothetical protein